MRSHGFSMHSKKVILPQAAYINMEQCESVNGMQCTWWCLVQATVFQNPNSIGAMQHAPACNADRRRLPNHGAVSSFIASVQRASAWHPFLKGFESF